MSGRRSIVTTSPGCSTASSSGLPPVPPPPVDTGENLDFHVVLRPPEPRRAPVLPRFDEVDETPAAPKNEGTLAARLRRARDDDF